MSSGVRVPRGARGRVNPVAIPGCSSVRTEHPIRDRGVGGSSPFNQTSHWFESSRRGHAALAQWEERSPGTAEDPGSAPGGGSGRVEVLTAPVARLDAQRSPTPEDARSNRAGARSVGASPTGCIGGLTERKGARLLSDGRGQPRQRSTRCPSALEGMPRWLGHPVSKTGTRLCRGGSTPLPSAQFTARSSSGRTAAPQAADAGSSPARVTSGRSCAPRSVLQAQGLRWTTHKESRHALPPGHDVIQCAPFAE
jgi:hypothetical protein